MKHITKIPSLGELAIKYKTISKKQLEHANAILKKQKQKKPDITIEEILIKEGFATKEQIKILKLILDFLKLQETSKKFGDIAIKLGYATKSEINNALKRQHMEFRQTKTKKMIGDILVEQKIITNEQKNAIIAEQQKISEQQMAKGNHNKPSLKPIKQQQPPNQKITKELQETRGSVNSPLSDTPPLEINFSKDFMEARIRIKEDNNKQLSLNQIQTKLQEEGVKFSIYNEALLQTIINARRNSFLAALGKLPPLNKNIISKYLFNTKVNTDPEEESNSKENNKIKKGKTIAVLERVNNDYFGKDVLGRQINSSIYGGNAPAAFICGKGTKLSNDGTEVIAGRSGFPLLSIEKKLYVLSLTNVLEDADLKFGPIEEFSNINVSGILTGAFPVKAGRINAREIRGANIEALSDIRISIGITNANIKTQGNIYAKYIHNSTIRAFGNVIVEHEIIDSTIIISGQCKAIKSRIIASEISAKRGIICAGAGSDVTEPCTLTAGTETHIINETDEIKKKIKSMKQKIIAIETKKYSLEEQIGSLLKKMSNLKLFYDRAKKQQQDINNTNENESIEKDENSRKKTQNLRENLDEKMKSIIKSLKQLNNKKNNIEIKKQDIEKQLKIIKPKIYKQIWEHKIAIENLFQWAKKTPCVSEIIIKGKLAQGTVINGLYTSIKTEKEYRNIKAAEICNTKNEVNKYTIVIENN